MTTTIKTKKAALEAVAELKETRTTRYSDLITPDQLKNTHITVVGCGAIGRQVALQLASTGFQSFTLFDPDTVSEVNLGTQGWAPDQIGWTKVSVLYKDMLKVNPAVEGPTAIFTRKLMLGDLKYNAGTHTPAEGRHVVVCAVDSLAARREIFGMAMAESTAEKPVFDLWVDARMSAEEFEIYNVVPTKESAKIYLKSLDPAVGPPLNAGTCTLRSTFYCASIAAGMLVSQIIHSLRGDMLPAPFKFHIPSADVEQLTYLTQPLSGDLL